MAGGIGIGRESPLMHDPRWEPGHNKLPGTPVPLTLCRTSATVPCHTPVGAWMGGLITLDATARLLRKKDSKRCASDFLSASGIAIRTNVKFHALIGFQMLDRFNETADAKHRCSTALALTAVMRTLAPIAEHIIGRWRRRRLSPGGFATIPRSETGRRAQRSLPPAKALCIPYRPHDPAGHVRETRRAITVTIDGEYRVLQIFVPHTGRFFNLWAALTRVKLGADSAADRLDDATSSARWSARARSAAWIVSTIVELHTRKRVPGFHFGQTDR